MTAPEDAPAGRESITLDTRSLRALAHPVRVKLMSMLRADGPSTATRLAEQLGLNSGATSYHLRQLAAADLVREDPERGNARERWWRSAHRSTYFEPFDLPESEREASAVYLRAIASEYAERVLRAADEYMAFPPEWQRVGDLSDFQLRLTPAETADLVREVHAVVETYRRADSTEPPVEGAEVVAIQVQVMPLLPTRPAATERGESR